ncbi:MAG: hypothetical protein VKJ06_05795 [Vampirovibrionales bacterium]|nr:hypothetical protein [Vampirovibrionales bacterium]
MSFNAFNTLSISYGNSFFNRNFNSGNYFKPVFTSTIGAGNGEGGFYAANIMHQPIFINGSFGGRPAPAPSPNYGFGGGNPTFGANPYGFGGFGSGGNAPSAFNGGFNGGFNPGYPQGYNAGFGGAQGSPFGMQGYF